jgi:uncharacterized protein (TIGR00255 family)
MTGFGRAGAALGGGALSVQVSSVNRRSLDLSVSLPPEWSALEAEVGERVRRVASRGKVHVSLDFEPAAPAEASWNEAGIASVLDRLAALAGARGIPFEPTADLLWQISGSQRPSAAPPPLDRAREDVLRTLDEAVAAFAAMRAREGETLRADMAGRLGACRRLIDAVAARAPAVAPGYRALLMRRLREAGLELDLDDERVLREVALFADRCDVSEEVTRFRSHLDQLAGLLGSEEEIGRKADFILQELGREANTIGAKANDLEIAKAVIELKNELERVREQMANVE